MSNNASDIFNTRDWIISTNDPEDFENWAEDWDPTTDYDETTRKVKENVTKGQDEETGGITQALKCLTLQAEDQETTDDLLANIFIKDLLTCEPKGENFVYKDIQFSKVFICGTIISYNPRKNNSCFVIHDGTGSIMTMVDDKYLRGLADGLNEKVEFFTDDDEESEFIPLSMSLHQVMKVLPKSNPVFRDINNLPGIIVKLIGNLKCYNTSRYVFVSKIVEIDPIELVELLNRKLDLEEKYLGSISNRKK